MWNKSDQRNILLHNIRIIFKNLIFNFNNLDFIQEPLAWPNFLNIILRSKFKSNNFNIFSLISLRKVRAGMFLFYSLFNMCEVLNSITNIVINKKGKEGNLK